MKKLYELLALPKTTGLFGLEIETEGENLNAIDDEKWKTTDDGSLRGMFPEQRSEYVLKRPLDMAAAVRAVHQLAKHQEDAVLKFSHRCSVHVHMNVQDLTFPQYCNLLYISTLLETPLMRFCGKERIGNLFCLRAQDAEGLIPMMSRIFQTHSLREVNRDLFRYAAMNVEATKKYGSLEYRGMRGNMDVPFISNWLASLNSLKEYAKKHKDPRAIHDQFVMLDPHTFIESVFGHERAQHFIYPEVVHDVRKAFSFTIDLPYNYVPREEQAQEEQAGGKPVKLNIPRMVDLPQLNAAMGIRDLVHQHPDWPVERALQVNRVQIIADEIDR